MRLETYLKAEGIDPDAFARQIRVKPLSVARYCRSQRIPQPRVMKRIFAATKGAVTPLDFYNLSAG